LTIKKAEKAEKSEFIKIVQIINNQGPFKANQRVIRKKRKQANQVQDKERKGKGIKMVCL
jgi:hypothetical protein